MGIDGKNKADVFDEYFNKSIIIDGADVSKCEFLGRYKVCRGYINAAAGKLCGCNYNPNCYFKQLQKVKAENEQLKADYSALNNRIADLINQINQLKEARNDED